MAYFLALTICLTPGIRNRQLIPFIRQYLIDFWNNKKSNLNGTSTTKSVGSSSNSNPTASISSVRTTTIIRPTTNLTTPTLYSTTSYGTTKSKAQ